MTYLLPPDDPKYLLDVTQMDNTHKSFIYLVNRMGKAKKPEFIELFKELITHTEEHFEAENKLMQETRFPAINEHIGEHQRVLGDLHRIGRKVATGSTLIGRAYIIEQLPGWFDLHLATMDSALAAHLKSSMQVTA